MYQNTTGQVLGASTAVVAGAAVMPNTGGNHIAMILSIISVAAGVLVFASLIATRLLKQLIIK